MQSNLITDSDRLCCRLRPTLAAIDIRKGNRDNKGGKRKYKEEEERGTTDGRHGKLPRWVGKDGKDHRNHYTLSLYSLWCPGSKSQTCLIKKSCRFAATTDSPPPSRRAGLPAAPSLNKSHHGPQLQPFIPLGTLEFGTWFKLRSVHQPWSED